MNKVFGIDVSFWQGDFNFKKAMDEGVKFAILRGAYSTSKDKKFEQYYSACKGLKLPVGVYHYSMAKTVSEARAEANFLINNVLKGKQFEYPIYMDVEDKTQLNLGKDLLTDIVIAFCDTVEKAGYYVGLYSSKFFLSAYLHENKLTRFDKWIAQWTDTCTYKGQYGMWQFGGETNLIRTNKVAGVTCDQDYAYKDYPTIIKQKGLNGFNSNTPEPVKKSIDDIAKEVIQGLWGVGEDRKNRLTSAGYSYSEVQTRVNELLSPKPKPKPKTYTVKQGDTITSIAKTNNTTVDKLVEDNKLIQAGMVLKL